MSKNHRVFRLNPKNFAIAPMGLSTKRKDYSLDIQRMCRANRLGHQHICDVNGVPLYVAADAEAAEGQGGFRFRGTKAVTAGIGVLFGRGPGGGLVSAPIDMQWLRSHLVWCTAEEADADKGDEIIVVEESDEVADGSA